MTRFVIKASALLLTGVFVFGTASISAKANTTTGEKSLGGFSYLLDEYYEKNGDDASAITVNLLADNIAIPENIAIANVKDYVNIREKPGTSHGVIGYLPTNGYCIVDEIKDGWAKIKSGDVEGYISTDYLFTGAEGRKKAKEAINLMATVQAGTVNFRSEPSTATNNILAEVTKGEILDVIEETVISKDDNVDTWVKVYVDDMEGYVAKQFVTVGYEWVKAVSIYSPTAHNSSSGISAIRTALIVEAKKHLGLRYVWGGNSLVTGADCSGFCLAVYRECGISTKNMYRASYDICASAAGRQVSYSEAKPGDLVFYASSSGHVNHVAMYIGNGQIIHEAGRSSGCKISDINYRKVYKIKNFLD